MKKVVTIGGGTGSFMLLSGLKHYPIDISAIVSMADDGGSTGILRDELGVTRHVAAGLAAPVRDAADHAEMLDDAIPCEIVRGGRDHDVPFKNRGEG